MFAIIYERGVLMETKNRKSSFIGFLDGHTQFKYNKILFESKSDQMYRCKIINQYLKHFKHYCFKYNIQQNDIYLYSSEVDEWERKINLDLHVKHKPKTFK